MLDCDQPKRIVEASNKLTVEMLTVATLEPSANKSKPETLAFRPIPTVGCPATAIPIANVPVLVVVRIVPAVASIALLSVAPPLAATLKPMFVLVVPVDVLEITAPKVVWLAGPFAPLVATAKAVFVLPAATVPVALIENTLPLVIVALASASSFPVVEFGI